MTLAEILSLLHRARRAAGMSQRDVAKAMGTGSAASVCQWESGAKRPRADRLVEYADALGFDLVLVQRYMPAKLLSAAAVSCPACRRTYGYGEGVRRVKCSPTTSQVGYSWCEIYGAWPTPGVV